MAKKTTEEIVENKLVAQMAVNPLMAALSENDKKNLFQSNLVTYFHKTGFPLVDHFFGSVINIHNEAGEIIRQDPLLGQAAGTFNLLIGGTGSGKALPNSTELLTPSGVRTVGTLREGQEVLDEHGNPVSIVGVYPQGIKDEYIMCFEDGRHSFCSLDHLWQIYDSKSEIYAPLSVYELIGAVSDYNEDKTEFVLEGERFYILSSPIITLPEKEVSCDPYLVGLYLSRGGSPHPSYITINKFDKTVEKVVFTSRPDWQKERAGRTTVRIRGAISGSYVNTSIFGEENEAMISDRYNRKIPHSYKYNSAAKRFGVLLGLVDSDKRNGSVKRNDKYHYARLITQSSALVQDVLELCAGLGIDAYSESDLLAGHDTSNLSVSVRIPTSYIRAFLECRRFNNYVSFNNLLSENTAPNKFLAVSKIVKAGTASEMTCIKVDSPTGLFLTEQLIVTHNTTLAVQVGANIVRPYPGGVVFHYDSENRFDISRAENITGLPIESFKDEGKYHIRSGRVSLEEIQEMIVELYATKMKNRDVLSIHTGQMNEFGDEIVVLQPTVVILDSLATMLAETFSITDKRDLSKAGELRGNADGARDAKTVRGFFKDVLPLCKEANIIIYGITHITTNMSMNMFGGVTKQHANLKQDEAIPGGNAIRFAAYNIIKLTGKNSDMFTEESDGFNGHIVMVEPVKSSSNQSGNDAKGVSFELVFSYKHGFDPLRSMIHYGRENGFIEGTKNRMKFKDDPSFTFAYKTLDDDMIKGEKPIWECIKKHVLPDLDRHLSYVKPELVQSKQFLLDY